MYHELKRAARNIRKKGQFIRGLLGDFVGTIAVADRPGYYYVRVEKPGGYEVGIFPGRVRALYNLPVIIQTNPLTGVQYIAGTDDTTIAYGGTDPATVVSVDLHGFTHEWGGDDMLMWLHTNQIFPLRCQPHPTTGTSVVVQGGTYFSEGTFSVLSTAIEVDLSAYYPTTGHEYVLLYLESDGTPGVVDDDVANLADLSPAPAGMFWVAAIQLTAGTSIGWQDIADMRFLNSGVLNRSMYWVDLVETPDSFAGYGGYNVGVKGDETGLEFTPRSWLTLLETPSSFVGQGGKLVAVRSDELALEFVDAGSGGGGGEGDINITFQARYWTVDGPLAVADEVGGVWRVIENLIISSVSFYLYDTGTSSSTIIDIDVSNDGGATWSTLFTTPANRPALAGGASDKRADSVPDIVVVYAGDLLRINIDQVAPGARGLSAQIDGEVSTMTPFAYTVTLTVADTEYSQALPAAMRSFNVKVRGGATVRYAWETGKVATPTDPYLTLESGQTLFEFGLVGSAQTLYLASAMAGTVVEVSGWA